MATRTITFTAAGSGGKLSFIPYFADGVETLKIDNVSLRQVVSSSPVQDSRSVKEFLTGNTDEGKPIFFRADTQEIQFTDKPEVFATPISVITETERGSMVKTFVALEQDNFYELPGTVKKDVSIQKISSQTGQTGAQATAPMARSIRFSWRDSSLQLCRLLQAALIFLPTNVDTTE